MKYDDGISDGSASSGEAYAFVVHYSPQSTPFIIKEVKLYANVQGSGYENQRPKIEIWDKDLTRLHYWQGSATEFSREPQWMEVDIPDVIVDDDFYIVFYTNSIREGGVYIHYDSSIVNEHSEMTADGRIIDWIWEQTPKDNTNWMMRVIGISSEISTPVASVPVPTPTPAPTPTQIQPFLKYVVTVKHPETHLAHVSLDILDISESQFDLRIRPIAETAVDHDKPFIREVTITSEHGRIVSGPSFEHGQWSVLVNTEGADRVTIDYDVEQLLVDPGGAYESYIGEDFAVIDPNTLLLYPNGSEVAGTVQFIGPANWKVYSSWEEINPDNYSFEGTEGLENYLAFGPFNSRTKEIGETEITLSIYEGVESLVDFDESFKIIEDLTQYNSRAFKPLDKKDLHWIIVADPITGGGVRDESFLVSTVRMQNFWGIFAHEYVHLWNGRGVSVSPIWFREGATEFLTYKGLVDIGTIPDTERNRILLRDWRIYLNLIANGEDKAVSDAVRPDPNINYRKGHLVNYALDLTIQNITKGERDFIDLTRYLAADYWGKRISNDDLLQAVNHITGNDFSDFFSKYIYGVERLPLRIMGNTLALEE